MKDEGGRMKARAMQHALGLALVGLLAATAGAMAQTRVDVVTDGSGVLVAPVNLWQANKAEIWSSLGPDYVVPGNLTVNGTSTFNGDNTFTGNQSVTGNFVITQNRTNMSALELVTPFNQYNNTNHVKLRNPADGLGWVWVIYNEPGYPLAFNYQQIGTTPLWLYNTGVVKVEGELQVTGNATINKNLTVNGSTTLGDAAVDSLTINAGTVVAPNASGTNATNIANVGTLDARFLQAMNPLLQFGNSWQKASGGGWPSFLETQITSWYRLSLSIPPSSTTGWSRAGIYDFALVPGEASATPAGRGWTFICLANMPSDSAAKGLSTSFYFGANGSETGGVLTQRGLRVSVTGNAPTSDYSVVAACHNGTSETSVSANVSASDLRGGLLIRWVPVGGSEPQAGSKMQVLGRALGSTTPKPLVSVTLTGSLGATTFAGSMFVITASSKESTPGYYANWQIGGMSYFLH